MNILLPNSWLKDYLDTNASPQEFADAMSLTSVSIEKIEKTPDDFIYDIEITTNRPDLMSVEGIAREASAVLSQAGYKAIFKSDDIKNIYQFAEKSTLLNIVSDKTLVNRILAVIMEIDLGPSPEIITKRLTATGIRTINNVVDVTNYIMREKGHPSHVFDYDRLDEKKLIIRLSKKGEKIITLDDKEYVLLGNDIVADDGTGEIVDLLGIMGTANSVVTDNTKKIVLFLDNNNETLLRKTSMNLGIRTEAAILNEKGLDPELMLPTILTGIDLLVKNANGKVISPIIDIYPNKPKIKKVTLTSRNINELIGIEIDSKSVITILEKLGFGVKSDKDVFVIDVPTHRAKDIEIPEDIIEEIARVYGYHKIPNLLPATNKQDFYHQDKDEFFWIRKIKDAFKYWGFNETYTYSMVAEELFDGPIDSAVKIKNPLTQDHEFMRNSLIPSVIQVVHQNKNTSDLNLFEISNVYINKKNDLPEERLHLASVLSQDKSFYDAKGITEQLFQILGIEKFQFKENPEIEGCDISIENQNVGHIETLESIALELDLSIILTHASIRKKYKEPAKFPPIIEDVRVEIAEHYPFGKIEKAIKKTSEIVEDVTLLDVYKNKKTFRITYRSHSKTLNNDDIAPIRESITATLIREFKALIG